MPNPAWPSIMSRSHGNISRSVVFIAEMAGVFKPDTAIYHIAAHYLGLEPAEIMMVAGHKYDIWAASGLGFRTAFVARPFGFGRQGIVDIPRCRPSFGLSSHPRNRRQDVALISTRQDSSRAITAERRPSIQRRTKGGKISRVSAHTDWNLATVSSTTSKTSAAPTSSLS